MSAVVVVFVLMAYGARGFQLARQVFPDGRLGRAGPPDDDLYVPLGEDVDGAAAHTAGNEDHDALIAQEIRQNPGR
jgi:hypothetical protein